MSRIVYDACRRYKHYYKKHEDVKGWNRKYHDLDLSNLIRITSNQLNESRDELLLALFEDYNVCCNSMETSYDVPITPMGRFGGRMPCYNPSETRYTDVEFQDSGRFLNVLAEHLMKKRGW